MSPGEILKKFKYKRPKGKTFVFRTASNFPAGRAGLAGNLRSVSVWLPPRFEFSRPPRCPSDKYLTPWPAENLRLFQCPIRTWIFIFFLWLLPTLAFSYPDAWWKPFPRDQAKSWEILPQDAKRENNEVILSKRTALGIFSNFANTPFVLDNVRYESIEGLWQSLKYPDPDDPKDPRHALTWIYTRAAVRNLYGFEAKKAGDLTKENYQKLGISWVSYQGKRLEYKGKDKMVHLKLIQRASWAKILQNKKARNLLLQTGDLKLRPDHHQEKNAPPAYRYYDILMKIRQKLKSPSTEK